MSSSFLKYLPHNGRNGTCNPSCSHRKEICNSSGEPFWISAYDNFDNRIGVSSVKFSNEVGKDIVRLQRPKLVLPLIEGCYPSLGVLLRKDKK